MKKPTKYICIALTFGVLTISAGLFWPATSGQSPKASAEFQRGMDLVNQNRFSEAIEPLTSAFEGGYIEAGYWIGFSYRYITLPFGSPKKERFWYKKGAEAGDPYAMLALGKRIYRECSFEGSCSVKDHYWKWKSNYLLNVMEKDGDLQASWYKLNYLEINNYDSESKKDRTYFLKEIKRIASSGYDEAASTYYLNHSLANEKESTAISILINSAKNGGSSSAEKLGIHYYSLAEKVIDRAKNYTLALKWLKKSAKTGLDRAIYTLGSLYKGQEELFPYIAELYFYCRVKFENGDTGEWCGPEPRDEYDKNLEIPLSKREKKSIDKKAKNWLKENIISRNYKYFSNFTP